MTKNYYPEFKGPSAARIASPDKIQSQYPYPLESAGLGDFYPSWSSKPLDKKNKKIPLNTTATPWHIDAFDDEIEESATIREESAA
ncbi:MAG: hypothetical protein SFW65_08860 [Alphaproteobacteria bacterium]|nr:hypothetical protein [Alphaproteobacteria bacterium]